MQVILSMRLNEKSFQVSTHEASLSFWLGQRSGFDWLRLRTMQACDRPDKCNPGYMVENQQDQWEYMYVVSIFPWSDIRNKLCFPLYSYANYNKTAFFHSDMDIVRTTLEKGSNVALSFSDRPKGSVSDVTFCISQHALKPISCVKMGLQIDDHLSFHVHIVYRINVRPCCSSTHWISSYH